MIKFFLNILSFWTFNIKGWRFVNHLPPGNNRYVLVAAPHTSNWDFYFALLSFHKMKVPVKFTIKKEWLKFPFKGLMEGFGAIGIDRSAGKKKISSVDAMIQLFKMHHNLIICITVEGTRKKNSQWKTGFYHVALGAGVPIAIGSLDYKNKTAVIQNLFYPTGNMEADMRAIMKFFKNVNPKFPEKFAIDERYLPDEDEENSK